MIMESAFLVTTLVLACGGEYDDPRDGTGKVLPSGPNLKTVAPTAVEPYIGRTSRYTPWWTANPAR